MSGSPSIVPDSTGTIFISLLEDFGRHGQAWRETNDTESDRRALIEDMLDGQYEDVVRIVAFNTSQGWSLDVTESIANELRETCSERGEMPDSVEDFIREHASHTGGRQLRFQL
jgi:hypothetical protein